MEEQKYYFERYMKEYWPIDKKGNSSCKYPAFYIHIPIEIASKLKIKTDTRVGITLRVISRDKELTEEKKREEFAELNENEIKGLLENLTKAYKKKTGKKPAIKAGIKAKIREFY